MDDSYLGMLQEDPFAPYYGYYYGSQVYVNVPATSPGPSSGHFVHLYVYPSQQSKRLPSTSQSSQAEDSREREDESRKRGKGPKKQAAKYDSFEPEEELYLVNLWVSYHEMLESKDARKYLSKIVDELNAKYNHTRNVEKCKRKMKYLVDKYKERKDWNRKQSDGSIWKSPHRREGVTLLFSCICRRRLITASVTSLSNISSASLGSLSLAWGRH